MNMREFFETVEAAGLDAKAVTNLEPSDEDGETVMEAIIEVGHVGAWTGWVRYSGWDEAGEPPYWAALVEGAGGPAGESRFDSLAGALDAVRNELKWHTT